MTSTEKAIRDFCGHHADWWPSVSQVQEMLSFAQPCKTCEALARTVMMDQTSHDATPPAQPATVQEPVAWAEEIIADLHALYDSEMITENDSGDALIRLDAAVCAVEEAEQRHTTPPAAQQIDEAYAAGYSNGMTEGYEAGKAYAAAQRKPLTDEQISALSKGHITRNGFARAIEAAHGIKENT